MSRGERRRSKRDGQSGDRFARAGRRTRGLSFRTAVEWLEPRCMLSAQAATDIAVPTIRLTLASSSQATSTPAAGFTSPSSNAYTPTDILSIYGFNQVAFSGGNGAGQTIAIIDAYLDPGIASDTATFSLPTYYDLPQFGSTGGPTLTITGENGGAPPTATDPSGDDWALETSLDVEWVHALAPQANILLVEANSDNTNDLLAGVQFATSQANVSVVSMSWGAPESELSNESSLDSTYFTTPSGHQGITFVTSAGDTGTPGGYPAYSPNVLSVGGTKLNPGLSPSANYSSETVWNDGINQTTNTLEATGGGISAKEAEAAYQDSVVPAADSSSGTRRAMPDVAFDADPNTGVAIVDSFDYGASTPWIPGTVGGTSFGAPAWASIVAIADQGRAIEGLGTLDGPSQTLPEIYAMPSTNFHDITSGSNNTYNAAVGYDLVTGRGTPMVSSVVGYLDSFNVTATTPAAGSTVHGSPTSFTVTFSDAYSTSGLIASDFEVNGIAATSFTDTSAKSITFSFSSSPLLSNQSSQTMTMAAGAIDRVVDDSPLVAFSGTFIDDTLEQIAVVSTTPAAGSSVVVPMTSLTVQFNEAYAASSISPSNLTLSEGSVTGFTLVNSTTVTYLLSGLTTSGTLTVTIAAGAITDTNGGAGAAFIETFILTTGLVSGIPAGSLVYEASAGGTIATQGASQSYTLNVAAGETISAVVDPDTLSQVELQLSGPAGFATETVTATARNQALLQAVAAVPGTYTFTVSSTSQFRIGSFTLDVFLNAAVSTSAISGASNNQFSSAQSIASSFVSTGPTASRAAVVGETGILSRTSLSDYYSFTLAAGQTVTLAVADQSGAAGTINVSLLNSSDTTLATGTPMTTNVDGAVENFTAPTAGTYYAKVTGTTSNITYVLVVTRGADFDLKANGTEATAQNISGTTGVLGAITSSASPDWYAVTLAAGAGLTLQTYTFGGTTANQESFIDTVQPQIQFYSPSGTLLATGSGGTNQSLSADAPVAGTYYIEVTGGSGSTGEYFLGTSIDSLAPAVSITPIAPNPTNAPVSQMQIVFNEAVSGMSLADLSLTVGGGPNLLTSAQTLTTTDNKTFTLGNLAPLTGGNGVYTLTVAANPSITDPNGFALLAGASTIFTVDSTPPEVTGVYVSGAAWTPTYLNYLASQGLGSAQLGYLVPSGANQLQDLPWTNLTTISVVFNENVSVNTADSALQLIGSPDLAAPAPLSSATFTYTAATHTAQWTFSSPLATDKYLLSIPSADVADSLGSTLDGEWTTSTTAYPSGNGAAGGDFNFRFNILQGDVNQDGVVTGLDGNGVRLQLLENTTSSGYSPFYDVIGAGTITGQAGNLVRLNLLSRLPATDPSIPGGGSGDVVTAAVPGESAANASGSDSIGNPSAAASQSSNSLALPHQLAIGQPAIANNVSVGALSLTPLVDASWPTALKLVILAPAGEAHPTASHVAAGPDAVTGNPIPSAAPLDFVFGSTVSTTAAAPNRSLSIEGSTTIAEPLTLAPATTAWGIEGFALSAHALGDSSASDLSADTKNDVDRGDESPADWLTDLVLEQESDWLID